MALDLTTATNILVHRQDAEDVLLRWTGTLSSGDVWQVYADRVLVWTGKVNRTVIPLPLTSRSVRVEIGSAPQGEARTNLSSGLAPIPGGGNQVTFKWYGGRDVSDRFVAFNVYAGATPGAAVNYSVPVSRVAAVTDLAISGAGMGGAGMGGAGVAETVYSWTSRPLPSGYWNFAVKGVDAAGNESAAITYSATIATPPQQVPRNSAGIRLNGSYNSSTHALTLSWLASQP